MKRQSGFTRRDFIKVGGATLAGLSLHRLVNAADLGTGGAGVGHFEGFGVTEALLREVLSAGLRRGGDFSEIFFQHKVGNAYVLRDGDVNQAVGSVELGAGVRVVKGDQVGYGYTEDLTREALLRTAATAAAIASGAASGEVKPFHVKSDLPSRYPLELPWDQVPVQARLDLLQGLNAKAFAADPRIKKVVLSFRDATSRVLIANSDGLVVEDSRPMTLTYLQCIAEQNGSREEGYYLASGRRDLSLYTPELLDRIVATAVERTVTLFDAVPAPAGEMPVVMAAGSSGVLLHEAIGHGLEADFNRKGESIYSDRMGKMIAKPFVSIVDDGTRPGDRGALNVDDEGNLATSTTLVENGVLTAYLHDRISAAHYGVSPTGSGRRESYKHAPMPRMRSTYMLPGPHEEEEIIRSVKRGIYCQNFTNGQVSIGAGDFSFYVKNGFMIEDGRLTRPVKDVNIIGNGPEILSRIDMVANNLKIDEGGWTCGKNGQRVPVSQGMPSVRVSNITVGGRV